MQAAPDPPDVAGLDAASWLRRAALLQRRQDLIGADLALSRARALAPHDPRIAFLRAQTRYELGYPAAALFGDALDLDPANRDALRNRSLAEASEGQVGKAQQRLTAALVRWPDWLDGLRVLASLRWIAGDANGFDRDWAGAARAQPKNQALWLGWFGARAQVRDWPQAIAVLDEAQQHLGQTFGLQSARVFVAGESGALDQCAALLDALKGREDQFLQVARIRLALRRGDPAVARDVALGLLGGPGAPQAWSYLSTAWRLLDDPLADWLEGDPAFVRAHDVALSASDLTELAEVLRSLHLAQEPYAEQTVRGGTQSDRSVLLRHEPILQRAKAALLEAVQGHIAGLPPHDARHPLLSRPRGELKIAGSWSVRLGPGGFNVTHSHPMGWLSSAFYVACDARATMGDPPAGCFHWGAPPDELGIDLPARGTIGPVAGRLVLFPSYVWHGTVPIAAGERLNIAFDIVPRPIED